jgi:hypothetical protein
VKPASPLVLLGIVAFGVVAIMLISFAATPPAPSPTAPCSGGTQYEDSAAVPPHQTVLVGAVDGGGRLTVWSNSTTNYSLYLLNESQYEAYAAQGTGINGTVHHAPPSQFFWTSGIQTSTDNTLVLASGTWYLFVDNPAGLGATVNVNSETCGPS